MPASTRPIRLGVSFDNIYYESNTYLEGKKKVERVSPRDSSSGKKITVYGPTSHKRDWTKTVASILTAQRLLTQDIGTADLRFKTTHHKMIYVVGNEQKTTIPGASLLLDASIQVGQRLVHSPTAW
jgi:arginyl-tRNA synthetase